LNNEIKKINQEKILNFFKLMTRVVRPKIPKIKRNYEIQFSTNQTLNDETKKKKISFAQRI